ncbi:hypothetical protein [Bradymonas sediminis]|uniref:Uncharacterized protein n=1 Tax=Bradymonas sediminis TaxID=1548548 RepID=A0A2Z4FQ94_9DELT|nr:hypothetical protein [Bradymonas sediminis]AWV90826.1 hypothetical protein DN745_16465 [Bradymonas sediminis]TDP75439.1 hypothetical protein DFR33_104307 [Bradymonas sediminis]
MENERQDLESRYAVELAQGYAVLARMSGFQEDTAPNTGNVDDEIMLNAVYGGSASPEHLGPYTVYQVDWLDELPDEDQSEDALRVLSATNRERIAGEPAEAFQRYLDDQFKGWVYHHERGELYVIADQSEDDDAGL